MRRALECGVHAPSHAPSAAELIRRGKEPNQLHNNCSGKHANFLALARHLGHDHHGYIGARHPVQVAVAEALAGLTGAPHRPEACAIDGCSIPTYAVPLSALAVGFARFGAGIGISRTRAEAARRIYEAAVGEPFYVAGTGRICTEMMTALNGAALVKTGAEGVFCASLGSLGLGVALKADDGATRAAEAMMAAVIARFLPEHQEFARRWSAAPGTEPPRRSRRPGERRQAGVPGARLGSTRSPIRVGCPAPASPSPSRPRR